MLKLQLTPRQLCDLELLLDGSFAPLGGFLNSKDYFSVLDNMRPSSGELWPMPVCLDVSSEFSKSLESGQEIFLTAPDGTDLAKLEFEEAYTPDKEREALSIFGTTDLKHPGVSYLLTQTKPVYISGRLEKINPISHNDFKDLRKTPEQIKAEFKNLGYDKVIAFQTRNPLHRVHRELILKAMEKENAAALIHPVVGMTKPGDVDHYSRVRCYEKIMPHMLEAKTKLSLLNLAMRMAGPREALWHAIIRKNFGCTHFIVGRDHAGPGVDSKGNPFYGPYDAQDLVAKHEEELGIKMVPFEMLSYSKKRDAYISESEAKADNDPNDIAHISGTQVRDMLANNEPIPEWFSFKEVVSELRETYQAKQNAGTVLFFTGLSGSGKSTIANRLEGMLLENSPKPITKLDGDIVRQHLSKGLGFSKEDRDENIRRVGFVASEIAKHGGFVICAAIAPYRNIRAEVRQLVESTGSKFVEIHVSTPIETCEARDVKGLYEKARAGELKGFTGIDDPYEAPEKAELVLDASKLSVDEAAQAILRVTN